MSSNPPAPHVLVVDDEKDVADLYAAHLEGEYETTVVYGGEDALEAVDDAVDAVLLDRRMPDLSGDEVLAEIRERGLECRVVMVTAVDPDLNILNMEFDDYLCKPVDADTLRSTLEGHLSPRGQDPRLEEFFAIISKLEVLEAERSPPELERHDRYAELKSRAGNLAEELRTEVEDFEELVSTHREIGRSGSNP